jgi:hypothetical protein
MSRELTHCLRPLILVDEKRRKYALVDCCNMKSIHDTVSAYG